MTIWGTISSVVVLIAGGILTAGVLFGIERRRIVRLRRRHLQLHRQIADEEFVRMLEMGPEEGMAACRVRQAIAEAMGVPEPTLHPSDD